MDFDSLSFAIYSYFF